MTEEKFHELIEAVKVLPFRSDDVIVLKFKQFLPSHVQRDIRDQVGRYFDNRRVLILDGDADIEVVRKEE